MTTPFVEVWKFTDPVAVPDGMQVIDQDVISLDQNPFSAERVMVRLETAIVLFHRTSHRLKTHTMIAPDLMAFVAIGPNACGTIDGMTMRPDQLIAVSPGSEANMVVDACYSSITLLIPPHDLATHLAARRPGTVFQAPNGVVVNAARGPNTLSFFRLGKKLTATAARTPNVFNDSQASRIAGQSEILINLLAALYPATDNPPEVDMRAGTRANYSQIICLAEEFALAHLDDRVFVADLCRAAGVSERTLQLAFQEIMQITPVAYLNRVKLHRARACLLAASPASTTITSVAMDWGFWHFGEFTKAYKACFHETPSQTLRRKSDE